MVPPSAVQSLVARMCPGHANWKWEAVAHGANAYLIAIPSADDLARIDSMQMGVLNVKAQVAVTSWKRDDIAPLFVMEPAWIHVDGVPHTVRHFHGLWAVGSLIGSTLDVDLVSLRS
jgi:ABC-type taurine transport system substrate-binding protein